MKIRFKFRIISLVIILIMVGVVAAVYLVARVALTSKVHDHLNLVADLQQARVKDVLDRNFERLEQVSARTELRENVVRFVKDSVEDSRDSVNNILRDANSAVDSFQVVSIVEMDGNVIGSSNLDYIDASFAEELFYIERERIKDRIGEDGRAVSFDLDEEGGLKVVLSEPFKSEDGDVLGLIVIETSGENLAETSEAEGDTVRTLLVKKDLEGQIIVLTPKVFAGPSPSKDRDGPLVKAANEEVGFFPDARDLFRDVPVLAVTRHFGQSGEGDGVDLGFVAKMDRSVAFRDLRKIGNFSLIVLGLALVALEVAFFAMRKGILRPIQHLAKTATEISGGDLSRRVEVESNDEIGLLARDFNQMTEALVEANTGLERKVEERTSELEQSNADLAQFAYVASHDLKEPLRMVTSYVQLLERRLGKTLDEESKEFMGFAVDGAKRMRGLIDDLLAYSRVGTKSKPFERVSSEEIVGAALQNLKIAIDESEAEVKLGELPDLIADPTQLTQLFQNLIANAIKFRGDKKPVVFVGAQKDGRQWKFSVRDNGIGIDKEYLEQIFLIFQRLHKRTEYEGSGIGLAVCKKIVERHGGKISVESEPGQGTTFSFGIPAAEGRGNEGQ